MRKKMFLMLMLLVFVSGCTLGGGGGFINIDYERVYSGTDGIVVGFLKNAPQERLYADSPFKIGLDVANIGAHGTDVYLHFGFEKEYMNIEKKMFTINNLKGKDAYNLEGNHVYEFIDAKTEKTEETNVSLVEPHTALISLTYCYDYATTAETDVCIDTDLYGKMLKKVCVVSDRSLSSQGAPVAVKKVEVEMIPTGQDSVKAQFTIQIQNVGNGEVLENGKSLEVCGDPKKRDWKEITWDLVDVEAILSNERLECKKGDIVRLDDGGAEIRCSSSSISYDKGTYTAPLVIKLNYGYYSIITTEIEILREEI